MKKIILTLFISSLLLISLFLHPPKSFAGEVQEDSCSWNFTNEKGEIAPPFINNGSLYYNKVNFTLGGFASGDQYKAHAACGGFLQPCFDSRWLTADENGNINHTFNFQSTNIDNDIFLMIDDPKSPFNPVCKYQIDPSDWKKEEESDQAVCALEVIPPKNITLGTPVTVKGTIINTSGLTDYSVFCSSSRGSSVCTMDLEGPDSDTFRNFDVDNSSFPKTFTVNIGTGLSDGNYYATAKILIRTYDQWPASYIPISCSLNFNVPNGMQECSSPNECLEVDSCQNPVPYEGQCQVAKTVCCRPPDPPECTAKDSLCQTEPNPCDIKFCQENCSFCEGLGPPKPLPSLAPICEQLRPEMVAECKACMDDPEKGGIWTAIGCLPTDLPLLVKDVFFVFGLSIAGGIAFLYLIYGGFIFLTSSGNPERLAHGKEIIVSAMSGLLLIIFSIFLLRVIGVDILNLPGFS